MALVSLSAHASADVRTVLIVAGADSHAEGAHEFKQGAELLAEALNNSSLPLRALAVDGWPSAEKVADAAALILYSDGLKRHVAAGGVAQLREHVERGRGLAVLHFALEPSDPEMAGIFNEVLGGYFVVNYSVNPFWTVEDPLLADHPIAQGVKWVPIRDEWYYGMRFVEAVTPILSAVPPKDSLGADGPRSGNPRLRAEVEQAKPQVLAWVRESESGTRGFGFTGGHYHHNWSDPGYRTLVLNAIAWTAGVGVPEGGVDSKVAPIPVYATIDEAIARGEIEDVKRHLQHKPDSLHVGANPRFTPLQQAIMRRQEAIALLLIEAGAEVNQKDNNQRSLLHLCVDRNSVDVAKVLLAKGSDPHVLDSTGWTPMHHATAKDQLEMTRALIAGGADPMTRSARGGTALHEAAATAGAEVIHLLLETGVDPATPANAGESALDVARAQNNAVAIKILESL